MQTDYHGKYQLMFYSTCPKIIFNIFETKSDLCTRKSDFITIYSVLKNERLYVTSGFEKKYPKI